jgi:pullulanase
MKDTFLVARLVQADLIRLVIFSSLPYEKFETTLVTDRTHEEKIIASRITSNPSLMIVDYHLKEELALGHSYYLLIASYGLIPVDVSEATSFPSFDERYAYRGDDLGANCNAKGCEFVVWAPLASSVILKVHKASDKRWHFRLMEREAQGVFRLALTGDYHGASYHYLVTNSEVTVETTDPYAKASTPNGEDSVAVDVSRLEEVAFHDEALPIINSYTDAIIYEGNVRDLTIDRHSDIEKKGTYLGLIEKGRKTFGGNPAGLDYIKSLGITHFQLQPIYDFKTVDERHPDKSYNWGYDPAQYFVPEGSYSVNVEDPFSRLNEVRQLVSAFHEQGIRIVMDVVFNHVYEYLSSAFEKVVPNYYFRRKGNGRMANTSYCGDDVASERVMVRKLIVDACKWWIDFYHVDGFRFDLMGILDVATLKMIAAYGQSKNPSFIVYGEGWNMGGEVQVPLGTMDNAKMLNEFAFFNDKYREAAKHYLVGDPSSEDLFKYACISSSMEYGQEKARFVNANQSINYVECHDNATFFDFISSARNDLSSEEKLSICKMGLAAVLFSFGIPFIHAGEEIGQSKFGKDNTYNLPDVYNKFSYRLLDERKGMYDYVRSLIALRKKWRFLHVYDPRVIGPMVELEDQGALLFIKISDGNQVAPYQEVDFLLNPSMDNQTTSFPEDVVLLLGSEGDVSEAHLLVSNLLVPKHAIMAVGHLAKKSA